MNFDKHPAPLSDPQRIGSAPNRPEVRESLLLVRIDFTKL